MANVMFPVTQRACGSCALISRTVEFSHDRGVSRPRMERAARGLCGEGRLQPGGDDAGCGVERLEDNRLPAVEVFLIHVRGGDPRDVGGLERGRWR